MEQALKVIPQFTGVPGRLEQMYLSPDEIVRVARDGAAAGCKEALFTLGDRPEDRYPVVELGNRKIFLHALSYRSEIVVHVESRSKSAALVTSSDSPVIRACFRSAVAPTT